MDEKNEILIESIPPTSFTTNLYNRMLSWLPLCDIIYNIQPIQFFQPLITLNGCPPQKPIITLKGVPWDDKPLVFVKGKPNYTLVAQTYQT